MSTPVRQPAIRREDFCPHAKSPPAHSRLFRYNRPNREAASELSLS